MKSIAIASFTLSAALLAPVFADLEIRDTPGEHVDVMAGDKVLVRYMYAHDTSSDQRHHETYKPYLHVFDAEGKKPITKGAGGQFTHHRGIFLGWSKLQFKGKSYDRWHMRGGDIVHQKFVEKKTDGNLASVTAFNHWMDGKGSPLLDEERSMKVMQIKEGSPRLAIDFQSVMKASYGDVFLKGDPEHAGIQYRPANEVDKKKTKYSFPEGTKDVKKARDLPWIGETYVLDGKTYSVVQLNHPDNPKGTRHSAYRDYGRFGSFFEKEIKEGESLKVRYGYLIFDGEMPERAVIEKAWKAYSEE